jgi:hypothetical protein
MIPFPLNGRKSAAPRSASTLCAAAGTRIRTLAIGDRDLRAG